MTGRFDFDAFAEDIDRVLLDENEGLQRLHDAVFPNVVRRGRQITIADRENSK